MRATTLLCLLVAIACGQDLPGPIPADAFRQLDEILPTPNSYRTASGAPGHAYWQQEVDYDISVELDDENQRLIGREIIHYTNNSPDDLRYLWLQIDANIYRPDADAALLSTAPDLNMSLRRAAGLLKRMEFDGGAEIEGVYDAFGEPLPHTIVKTMMRVDLPEPLVSGAAMTFKVDWNYTINDSRWVRGRTACEYFEEDGNFLYEIAQWFPRLCPYSDVDGWQNKQFLGRGEFALEFGDYTVRITAPEDHIVASTGVLQNPDEVLSETMRERLKQAESAPTPMFIVTPEEALENQKAASAGTKTWVYKAENIRDFAWASSRKFIWDAQLHTVGGQPVWAMSYYPNEGEPLWSRYSTHAIIHTLDVYSRYTFDYPYPVAISVNGPVGGMEYPMLCFNGPRPEKDGTYSARTKYGLISVIIHEVGHNYFPMIINSDERQWTWMDEGLNTFVQFLAEQEWEEDYPSRRGEARNIVSYMASERQVPIMTNSESILQFGANAYAKPATALNVLRETVLGRELFDFAFKEYARRWKFKRPTPADFFRTMEDASGIDLDWFWRGWFYSTRATDLGLTDVREYTLESLDPDLRASANKADRDAEHPSITDARNEGLTRRTELFPELEDFYNSYDPLDATARDRKSFRSLLEKLSPEEKALLDPGLRFYVVGLENIGGLAMPVILELCYADGSTEIVRLPAELWRRNDVEIEKLLVCEKPLVRIVLDPYLETADIELENNVFPRAIGAERFRWNKEDERSRDNPMRRAQEEEREESEDAGAEGGAE